MIRNVVLAQSGLGYDVTILTTRNQVLGANDPQVDYENRIRHDPAYAKAEIFFARAYGHRKPFNGFAYSPESKRWLRQRLSDPLKTPDLIHLHGIFDYATAIAGRLARRYSIPYLLEPFGALDQVLFQKRSRWLKKAYVNVFLRENLAGAASVHPASDHEVPDIRRWAPHARIEVIPHGADIPVFDVDEARRVFLERFPEIAGKRVILFFSRVDEKKRPEWLIESLVRLKTEHPDLAIVFAGGDSGHMPVVERVAKSHGVQDAIFDVGFLEGDLKHGAFAVSSVFALPSIDENFGIAVIEAMAHGVPVVVTPGVASHVYVDASGGGITVEDNIDALTNAINEVLQGDREEIGRRGREYVNANLSWANIARRIDELYRDAVARAV